MEGELTEGEEPSASGAGSTAGPTQHDILKMPPSPRKYVQQGGGAESASGGSARASDVSALQASATQFPMCVITPQRLSSALANAHIEFRGGALGTERPITVGSDAAVDDAEDDGGSSSS